MQSESNNNNGNYIRCLWKVMQRAYKRFCQVFDSQELHNLFNNGDNFIENSSADDISLERSTPSEYRQTKLELSSQRQMKNGQ